MRSCLAHSSACRQFYNSKVAIRFQRSTQLLAVPLIMHSKTGRRDKMVLLAATVVAAASLVTVYPLPWVVTTAAAFVVLSICNLVQWTSSQWQGGNAAKVASDKPAKASASEIMDLIRSRRSIYPKDFTGQNGSITKERLEIMLDAARWAPTHKLTEPWHFVVLQGQSKLQFEELTIKLCQDLLPAVKAEQTVAKLKKKQSSNWPKVHSYIVICMKRHPEVPEWEEIAAVSCAVQNMSLVATTLSISGYWSSWQAIARDAPEMQLFLGIDGSKGDRCLGVWSLGVAEPERVQGYRPKRQSLQSKVEWRT